MREANDEHAAEAGAPREAALGLLPIALLSRLFAGAPFAAGWTAAVVVPLVRVVESDVPAGLFVGAMTLATLAPALLYLRRHAMQATLRWDEHTVTLLRGGRVATSIAWRDATIRQRVDLDRVRVVQIADSAGRVLTLATGGPIGRAAPAGRARISSADLVALLACARDRATFDDAAPEERAEERPSRAVLLALLVCITIALFAGSTAHLGAAAFALACVALLLDPARRLVAALAHPEGRETLVIDAEERGLLRARRLDGSRILLDLEAAHHPDAMLAARRGFVNAVLAIPADAQGTPYRSLESPIPATFVETRDDRVLRFERLRAALVDVLGYGAFFATGVAAALAPL